jgi:hypothetical protein
MKKVFLILVFVSSLFSASNFSEAKELFIEQTTKNLGISQNQLLKGNVLEFFEKAPIVNIMVASSFKNKNEFSEYVDRKLYIITSKNNMFTYENVVLYSLIVLLSIVFFIYKNTGKENKGICGNKII